MTLKIAVSLLLLFISFFSTAQNKKSIDSINSIPYNQRLEKATILDVVYLKNAQDAQKLKYTLGEAESFSNLSLVYYYQGKYQNDLYYSLKAISIFEKAGAIEKLALEYGELGYRMKNRNLGQALVYLGKGKQLAETNHFQKPLLSIYNNYGVLKEMQEQYDSALYFYKKGLDLKENIKDSTGIPYSLNNIAGIYVIHKQFDEAKKLYDRSLLIRQKLNDKVGISENYSLYGDLYFEQKKYNDAVNYYQKTLENASRYRYTDLMCYSYKKLSECYELLNNTNLAFTNFKKYTQYKDSLVNKETNSKIAELEVKFETNNKEKLLLQKDIEAKHTQNILIAISALAFFLALIGLLIYRQQKLKHTQLEQKFQLESAIKEIETQNKLHEQRLSISRDLHDNIGAQLTFIISSVDNLTFGNRIADSRITNQLSKINDFARSTIIELRDTIWAMNNNELTLDELRSRIFNFIEKARSANENIAFNFSIDPNLDAMKFSALIGINLYRTLQEAVNNAIKYAKSDEITINVTEQDNNVKIEIHDNGKGFDYETIDFGNGINNMKRRIEEVQGLFEIHSITNAGTTISILIPKN
jgi:signal transduction histidine kinase